MSKIATGYEKQLAKQSYAKQEFIEGVKLIEIRNFVVEDGTFNEIVRMKDGKIVEPEELQDFELKQINHGYVVPGTRKSWHLHKAQDEVWFIHPNSRVLVGLLDTREGIPTKDKTMRLVLGGGKTHLLYIPRGVAHGLSNPYRKPATMTYLVNNVFNGEDELRLPFGTGVPEDFWEIRTG